MVDEQNCRICGGELEVVLDLGEIYPSSFLKPDEKLSEEDKAPLVLAQCKDCSLVQLKHTIDLDLMYRQYWYSSSLNKSMISSLSNIVSDIESKIRLEDGNIVMDIGCNDGTLLSQYSSDLIKVGFDPALNLDRIPVMDYFINDFFSKEKYVGGKPRVITAIAMFYDLPDPNKFVSDVKEILDYDGIFVIQFTDLLSMFMANAFDNICHEHLEYYKLSDVKGLLEKHGLEIIDVTYNYVNGGSVRITACHTGEYPKNPRVLNAVEFEKEFFRRVPMKVFAEAITETKEKVQNFFRAADLLDLSCFSLGASTKGNTLFQLCGITSLEIPYAAEVNKEKFGLRTGGSNITIISEDEAFARNPDFFFVPIWHFEKSLLENEKIRDYVRNGGTLIFPLPMFHAIGKDDLKDD